LLGLKSNLGAWRKGVVPPAVVAALVQKGRNSNRKYETRGMPKFCARARNFPGTRGLSRSQCFWFEILKRWHFCTCVSHVHLGLGPGSLSLSEREIVLKSKSNFLFPNDKLQRLDIGMVLFDLELRGVPENLRNLSKVYKFTP
jgi:hypothetical protein